MKQTAAIILITCSAVNALAVDTITFPAQNGDVIFPHSMHMEIAPDCLPCHESPKGGNIAGFDRKWVQINCKLCHVKQLKGPTMCVHCHKKKAE